MRWRSTSTFRAARDEGHLQLHTCRLQPRGSRGRRVLDQRGDRGPFALEVEPALLGTGHEIDVGDQPVQAAGRLLQQRPRVLAGFDHAVGERLEVPLDGGQRRAQLVGEVGQQSPAGRLGVLELVSHPVERVGQVGQLVVGRRPGGTRGQLAARELVGGVGERLDGAGDTGREEPADRQRGDDGGQDAHPQRDRQGTGEGLLEVVGDDVADRSQRPARVGAEQRRADEDRDHGQGHAARGDDQRLRDQQPANQPPVGRPTAAHAGPMR